MRASGLAKRYPSVLLLGMLMVLLVAGSSFAATPLLRGEMGMEFVANKDGVKGYGELDMTFDIGLSGAHRARVSLGGISGGKAELGSATRPWTLGNQIRIAYLEHTGPFTETGPSVRTRLGMVFAELSRNVAYVSSFQGVQMRGFRFGDAVEMELVYGWQPQTASFAHDTVYGVRLDGRFLDTDAHYVLMNSEAHETNFSELGIARDFGPLSADALFMDNGTFNAYQFGASMPWQDWQIEAKYTDWGAFEAPYSRRTKDDLYTLYSGKYNVMELGVSGAIDVVDVGVGLQVYDDLSEIQTRWMTEAEVPFEAVTLSHELELNQNQGKLTQNEFTVAGSFDVFNWLRDIDWSVSWDTAKSTDAIELAAAYTAPNRIKFEAAVRSDSGPELIVSSKLSF